MKNSNIFIPKKIKVGFNVRNDTYTKKLAYIIYHDGKTWRKEKSWNDWIQNYISEKEFEQKVLEYDQKYYNNKNTIRDNKYYCDKHIGVTDKSIIPQELENEPLEGFVLNKKAGGEKYSWNQRQTYCRVYDPRGFEFEITIENLLYILENTNSIKGKGLEGKFIYGWSGKDLFLIPEQAPEFEAMLEFTENKTKNITKKDLIKGATYLNKRKEQVVYLDNLPLIKFEYISRYSLTQKFTNKGNRFYFYNLKYNVYEPLSTLSSISKLIDNNIHENFNDFYNGIENDHFIKIPKTINDIILYDEINIDEIKNYNKFYLLENNKIYCYEINNYDEKFNFYYILFYSNEILKDYYNEIKPTKITLNELKEILKVNKIFNKYKIK